MICKCGMEADMVAPSVDFCDCGAVYIDGEEYVPAITAERKFQQGITALEETFTRGIPAGCRDDVLWINQGKIRAAAQKLREA